MAADAVSAMAVFIAVSVVRFEGTDWRGSWLRAGVEPIALVAIYGAAWMTLLWLFGMYRMRARWTVRSEALDTARAGTFLAVLTFAALYVAKLPEVSRLFLLELFPTQVVVTFASRLVLRAMFATARDRGFSARFVLVVGTGPVAQSFADRIERHRELGLRVVGHLEPGGRSRGSLPTAGGHPSDAAAAQPFTLRRPILGRLDEIEDVLHARVVDEVVICLPPSAWGLVEAITRICEEEGKIVRVPLLEGALSLPGARHEEFDGIPILSLVYGPDRILGLLGKRVLDVVLASIALIVLSPALLVIGAFVRATDGPPVLFRQTRVGLHGREFRVVKFRTMVPDAEERLEALLEQNEIEGHAFKLSVDPRLTRTGRWLRRTSFDELPQLWNVLRGEMSIVGPRPPLPREVAGYDVWHRRRLSMKPGITGLWQVSARHEETFDRWVELDLDYIDRWSLWLDFKIMLRTLPAMLQGR
jgi:exopolysaccharide biosynthesis polyprenyl glycosylphosphotransferase